MESPTWSTPLQQQLFDLLSSLHQLGREMPQVLIFLSELAHPQLSPERRIPALGKMFEEVPLILQNPTTLQKYVIEPPQDLVTLRLLLDMQEIFQILQQMTDLQMIHLTNNIIPPGPPLQQLDFLQKAQEYFQSWTQDTLLNRHNVLSDTPLHMERQQLLELEPRIPWELLHFLIELLKLPMGELYSFQQWFSKLPTKPLFMLLHLLQMEPSELLEIKRKMDTSSNGPSIIVNSSYSLPNSPEGMLLPSQVAPSTPIMNGWSQQQDYTPPHLMMPGGSHVPPGSLATVSPSKFSTSMAYSTELSNYQLRIARQPPSRTVYQRILKPFPAIMLIMGGVGEGVLSNLFVEASMLRSDSDVELSQCLEGNRIVRITNGVFATFKKLKILSTTQQQGTLFRLRFTLKRYTGSVFESISSCSVTSNPIEVFSHTLYLSEKQEAPPPPPTLNEILPGNGVVGSRVVLLGASFVNSPSLMVKIGDTEASPTFHEQGTLICVVPPLPQGPGHTYHVRVSNDGINYSDSRVLFKLHL